MVWVINTEEVNGPFTVPSIFPELDDEVSPLGFDELADVGRVFKTGGRELTGPEVPSIIELYDQKNASGLPGFFKGDGGALLSGAAAAVVIERFDPGEHQLIRLDSVIGGQPVGAQLTLVNVWRRLPSIVPERSAVTESKGLGGKVRQRLHLDEEVAVAPGSGGGRHLWRDEIFPAALLASDEIVDALGAAGALDAVPLHRCL